MSSWKKAAKVNQKVHRERHQPESRKHLGLLEKHHDYVNRAKDHHEKRDALHLLKVRALNRNPDEFYHHMIKSKVTNGVHREKNDDEDVDSSEQIKLMKTQDSKYINHKLTIEKRKIDKLKSQLHQIDRVNSVKNNHILFVEDDKELKTINVADRLDTVPELLAIKANRPRKSDLKTKILLKDTSSAVQDKLKESYKELGKRMKREKELSIIARKIEISKSLKNKKNKKPIKVKSGNTTQAPSYVWKYERKK